jgi:lysozyme family protein
MDRFLTAMTFISKHEWGDKADGGYTDDSVDPGGETKFGVSKRANPDLDIKNLTKEQAFDRYRIKYWGGFNLESLPWPYSAAVFDSYIQHRESVVKKMLERSEGDLRALLEERRVFYLKLIAKDPKLNRFKKGWLNRINDLAKFCEVNKSLA